MKVVSIDYKKDEIKGNDVKSLRKDKIKLKKTI